MIELLLKSKKKQAKDGRQFRTYFTDVMIVVKGEEEKGKQKKTLTVKFDQGVSTKDIVRGLVQVEEKDIDLPFKYQVKEKDGKETYPTIYIRKIAKYEERKGASTIEFLLDENDTEETVIDEEAVEQENNED